MLRSLTIVLLVVAPGWASAQEARFRWQPGQVLTYKVVQSSSATENSAEKASVTETRLELTKKWQVVAVDAAGVATLSMSLDRLRMETKPPTGVALIFDSSAKDKSTPALIEEMSKYIGVPLTVIRMDSRGQLTEVKESKFGPASRLEADLPFKLTLPATALAPGVAWDRKYQVKLEPPHGAGESYAAQQSVKVKSITGPLAVLSVSTTITGPVENQAEQIPLLPLQPAGEIVFDLASGRLKSVRYQWTKEVAGTQGEGSKYTYINSYVEELQ